jgi:hypothetical protein
MKLKGCKQNIYTEELNELTERDIPNLNGDIVLYLTPNFRIFHIHVSGTCMFSSVAV